MLRTGIIIILILQAFLINAQLPYYEEYRPQFHFSPKTGWIGDPNGLIRFKNKYHLFWWGHATSTDLVHWTELPWPMKGDNAMFDYYTGSVVVDENNTSGFGNGSTPPMVAIYTAHIKASGIQDQRLSYSSDYESFQYYDGSPVLTLNKKDFRDPDVFWDKANARWVMAITLPVERKINFYASADLRSWTYLSSFGPVGAREQVWEVPSLFQLPLDGDRANKKWVLLCGMGPNKMQYFIGMFDGTTFILDSAHDAYLNGGAGISGTTYAAFEGADYEGWTTEGTAFGLSPAAGTLAGQATVSGYFGNQLINSYFNGDSSVGRLTSPFFSIEKSHINFLIGGGNHPGMTCVNLLINGSIVRTVTGSDSEVLKWRGWNVTEYIGQQAQIQIVDDHTGGWGHINVDHIMFSDKLMDTNLEHASWLDWGPDFYAGRVYRDYDQPDTSKTILLGWMGNWEYANSVPTFWGRGAQSIPREIELVTSSAGYLIKQKPIDALQKLRQETFVTPGPIDITQTMPLTSFKPTRNSYEIEAAFEIQKGKDFGLNFFVGGTNKISIGYDVALSSIYLDRRYSGNTSFSPKFPKYVSAPFNPTGDTIKFHVFVDQSSIEVFVNDGECVLTSLSFPYSNGLGVDLFSKKGTTKLLSLTARMMNSVWGVETPGTITNVVEDQLSMAVFPTPGKNDFVVSLHTPVEAGGTVTIFNTQGCNVYSALHWFGQGQSPLNLRLSAGIYLIRILIGHKAYFGKLLIDN